MPGQGYNRIHGRHDQTPTVIQDRVVLASCRRDRIVEALETALKRATGGSGSTPWMRSTGRWRRCPSPPISTVRSATSTAGEVTNLDVDMVLPFCSL